MSYIPIDNKVSLINKYIQINIMRNKGKAMHVDFPENDIFLAIIDDIKTISETPEPEDKDLELTPVINALRSYEAKQSDMRFQMNALMKSLENYQLEETDQVSLDDIIKQLKDLEEG